MKAAFINGEGDAWYARNRDFLSPFAADPVVTALRDILPTRILEIGCGGGERLEKLHRVFDAPCFGIDPSCAAIVTAAKRQGVLAQVGTADKLPFLKDQFDCVVFGFCLYLCDRGDLFQIASEADRVLADRGHLVIYDFDNEPSARTYKHRPGVVSYRMRYAQMFLWHPAYSVVTRTNTESDIYVTVLRKNTDAFPLQPENHQ